MLSTVKASENSMRKLKSTFLMFYFTSWDSPQLLLPIPKVSPAAMID